MQKYLKKSESVVKYLVAAILLVVPLYPKFPFIKVPGTFVSIRLEDFIILVSFLILLYLISLDVRNFTQNRLNKAIFLYLSAGLISLTSAVLVTKSAVSHLGFLHWARRVEYFIPFFLGSYAIKRERKDLDFYIKTLMFSVSLAFIFGLGQRYLNWPMIVTQNLEYSQGIALRYTPGGHISSTFAGHYDLGTFLVLLLPFFISFYLLVKKSWSKVVILFVISASLWLLSHSGSRISVISYLVGVVTSLFLIKKYKAIPVVIAFSLIFFSTSPNLIARYSRLIQVTKEKLIGASRVINLPPASIVYAQETPGGGLPRRKALLPTPTPLPVFEDRSTAIRLKVEWPRAIRAFTKNPLLGTGYSSLTLATDNDLLRIMGEVGLLGFLSFTLIFIWVIKQIWAQLPLEKNYKGLELAFTAGIAGALPGVLINAFILDIFEASKFAIIFWLIIGMLMSLLKYDYYEEYN